MTDLIGIGFMIVCARTVEITKNGFHHFARSSYISHPILELFYVIVFYE